MQTWADGMGCFRTQKNTESPVSGTPHSQGENPSAPLAEELCPAIPGKLSEQEEVSAQEHLCLAAQKGATQILLRSHGCRELCTHSR